MNKMISVSLLVPLLVATSIVPVFASGNPGGEGSGAGGPIDPVVSNSNFASVSNTVVSRAYTGGNMANTFATSGGGGTTANTNIGAGIETGGALANTSVLTAANGNLSWGMGTNTTSSVANANTAYVTNGVRSLAVTGRNVANTGASSGWNGWNWHSTSTTANTGVGGTIISGPSQANTRVANYLNVSITRF